MKNYHSEKKCFHSIRTLAVGACSVMIGMAFLGGPVVSAEEVAETEVDTSVVTVAEESPTIADETEISVENLVADEEIPIVDEVVPTLESTPVPAVENRAVPAESEPETVVSTPVEESGEALKDDVHFPEETQLRPKEVKFDTWTDLLNWQPDARGDDALNRGSVELAKRHQGEIINPKASSEAKVQALSNMNSKAENHASVGGEEFKAYAFDYWQYVDSMVFWDGLVPTPDVIDAAHRNGVPIYGSLFFNWSSSQEDQDRLVEAMQQDENGGFPIARKLVDIAKYYGYDGYFINQETDGQKVSELPEKIRDFMLYIKEYGESVGHPIKVSWYDSMTNSGRRHYVNGVSKVNDYYIKPVDGKNPADTVFANFNWSKRINDTTVGHMTSIGRNPFDVFAGFELQQGGSYHSNINWNALIDKDTGKLRLSLGLFSPDTITSLGKTGEDYHENENIFWTGYQGNPTGNKPTDKKWYGIANLVADRTPIVGRTFHTSFNTGHGKKWFVDGKVSKDSEWNYRSVSGILPTWRWWVTTDGTPLGIHYDFDDAYNGGNSLAFKGAIEQPSKQDVMLYSTKLETTASSTLRLSYQGGEGAIVKVGLATTPDYKNVEFYTLPTASGRDWKTESFDLTKLTGKTIYGIKLTFEYDRAVEDYSFKLGELSIVENDTAPATPTEIRVKEKSIKNAQDAEAILQFKGNDDADYYEVYAEVGNEWKLLTGSSSTTVYIPRVTRTAQDTGTTQRLKVVSVGRNGIRSEAGIADFDWGLTVRDTTLPREAAPNVVLGAVVTGTSYPQNGGNEGPESMLNGTITSLSDKWCITDTNASVDIKLTQPRTIVRWVVDHAGAGGESVNDGLMNTKDFDLYYKNENGEWQLAKAVRGNKAHTSDIILDQPITAQEWRMHVITADNGTPWKAIRIYNWKMYEKLDMETPNIPMHHALARDLGNNHIQLGFKDVPANTTIRIYDSNEALEPIAVTRTDRDGNLILDPIAFDKRPSVLYYRAQAENMDMSNLLAVVVPKEEKVIKTVSWENPVMKRVYKDGEALSLAGATIRVSYGSGEADKILPLAHTGVSVEPIAANQYGEQRLAVKYLGRPLATPITVYVLKSNDTPATEVVGLEVTKLPKSEYVAGEDLVLDAGLFKAWTADNQSDEHRLTDEGVTVTGYDKNQIGEQILTLTYRGASTQYMVRVLPKTVTEVPAPQPQPHPNTTPVDNTTKEEWKPTVRPPKVEKEPDVVEQEQPTAPIITQVVHNEQTDSQEPAYVHQTSSEKPANARSEIKAEKKEEATKATPASGDKSKKVEKSTGSSSVTKKEKMPKSSSETMKEARAEEATPASKSNSGQIAAVLALGIAVVGAIYYFVMKNRKKEN
ncbi:MULTISPECIES: bacterial Ig-like domain-containing protein [unclassified Streptococcus]|uniref:endo-beta-N-acetylglucosaminidase n=1 Tax=unclassified Streptococcus TaxID=2608887 RepID=UPI00211ADFCD|nr:MULTISPECIES: bacterial Ig-like domain-containing protein [unclassified Streptococcus]